MLQDTCCRHSGWGRPKRQEVAAPEKTSARTTCTSRLPIRGAGRRCCRNPLADLRLGGGVRTARATKHRIVQRVDIAPVVNRDLRRIEVAGGRERGRAALLRIVDIEPVGACAQAQNIDQTAVLGSHVKVGRLRACLLEHKEVRLLLSREVPDRIPRSIDGMDAVVALLQHKNNTV